ncbi:MAG: RrF2 family transcriptional regulator [Omnitrophica WOR_2 bacterium]
MLRINRKTDYAVRVMLALARRGEGIRISSSQIRDEMSIPHAYLQRIIADLSRTQLLQTYPGPNGGIQLGRPAQKITLKDIYEAIEGPLLISECLQAPGECTLDICCPVRSRWSRMQALFVQEMESVSLVQLAQESLVKSF